MYYVSAMTRGHNQPYVTYVDTLRLPRVITAREAVVVAKVVRRARMARVRRTGRPGHRHYIFSPRNGAEWRKPAGVL